MRQARNRQKVIFQQTKNRMMNYFTQGEAQADMDAEEQDFFNADRSVRRFDIRHDKNRRKRELYDLCRSHVINKEIFRVKS